MGNGRGVSVTSVSASKKQSGGMINGQEDSQERDSQGRSEANRQTLSQATQRLREELNRRLEETGLYQKANGRVLQGFHLKFKLTEEGKRQFSQAGFGYSEELDLRGAQSYYASISRAKSSHPFGAFVELKETSSYRKNRVSFTTDRGKLGASVSQDGDIVSVFKHPSSTLRGGITQVLTTALSLGGNKLDSFDGHLTKLYSQHGFIPVARTKFYKKYAPDGWDYKRDGKPDIVFWVHSGDSASSVIFKSGSYPSYDLSKIHRFRSYDAAKAYRDRLIKG